MKIAFLCGSLEPGRDGVGDYTRRLAGEITRLGNEIIIVALNDGYLAELFIGKQCVEGIALPVYRLPSTWSGNVRFNCAKTWIDKFDPDWISLQFVPFSYHPKGLSLRIDRQLCLLGEGKRWHIMFHELWVGINNHSSVKMLVWGWLQKQLIKFLVRSLMPIVIQTQTRIYQKELFKLGIQAKYLPLFSNIPLVNKRMTNDTYVSELEDNIDTILLVLFGTIQPEAPIQQFAKEVALFSKRNNKKVILYLIGRSGKEQNNWVKAWKAEGLLSEVMGELPVETISGVLFKVTFGLTTNPICLTEKSGTVAAMLEHGLPIVCVSKTSYRIGTTSNEGNPNITEYQVGNIESCFSKSKSPPITNNAIKISNIFLNSLSDSIN